MQVSTLRILRCPRCRADSLVPESTQVLTSIDYGPVRCLGCAGRFSISDGLLDFHDAQEPKKSAFERVMQSRLVARSWNGTVRPTLDLVLSGGHIDADREFEIIKTFLGTPNAPIVDLGCGTGQFLRQLSKDLMVPVIGIDASKSMLDEALDQARETGFGGDLIRTSVPPLPFIDHSLGAIVATGLFHVLSDLTALLLEAQRVLKPRGVLVATSYWDTGLSLELQKKFGFHPRSESDLSAQLGDRGFIHFECVRFSRVLVFKVEMP